MNNNQISKDIKLSFIDQHRIKYVGSKILLIEDITDYVFKKVRTNRLIALQESEQVTHYISVDIQNRSLDVVILYETGYLQYENLARYPIEEIIRIGTLLLKSDLKQAKIKSLNIAELN